MIQAFWTFKKNFRASGHFDLAGRICRIRGEAELNVFDRSFLCPPKAAFI